MLLDGNTESELVMMNVIAENEIERKRQKCSPVNVCHVRFGILDWGPLIYIIFLKNNLLIAILTNLLRSTT